jgi:tetratricopeptide (TPR) repeat protein
VRARGLKPVVISFVAPGDLDVPPRPGRTLAPMDLAGDGWEERVAELWAALDELDGDDFVERMDALAAEQPGSAAALFERAAALDSTGHPDRAVPLYRAALDRGVTGIRRRRAVIQMASSLRNLGRSPESVALLEDERHAGSDELDDAVAAVLALALVDVGRAREAASIAVAALAPHLARYQRSMANYARLLVEPE